MEAKQKFSLTERQKELLDYIKSHHLATGVMPLQSEMSAKFGVAQSTIAKHLMAMERRGWVQRSRGLKGAMTILD